MHNIRLSSLSNTTVFFDFDNTITMFDLLDDIIKHFSINRDWVAMEEAWQREEIGSRECLVRQLRNVRVNRSVLLQYLSWIKVDPDFNKLFALLRREGIKPVILSDNFTVIIRAVLENNGIKDARIYANSLRFRRDRLIPSFPHANKHCDRCAHCKKKNLQKKDVKDKIIMYIGDGISDICPAECSDIVFAKGSLLKHFRKTKRLCLGFANFDDIYNHFRGLEK